MTAKPEMKTGIYSEDDWTAEVEILEDHSSGKWLHYKLRVIKTIQESRMYKPAKNNHVFSVDRLKDCGCVGMWSLRMRQEGET